MLIPCLLVPSFVCSYVFVVLFVLVTINLSSDTATGGSCIMVVVVFVEAVDVAVAMI